MSDLTAGKFGGNAGGLPTILYFEYVFILIISHSSSVQLCPRGDRYIHFYNPPRAPHFVQIRVFVFGLDGANVGKGVLHCVFSVHVVVGGV